MGQYPEPAALDMGGRQEFRALAKLTDAQCQFLDENIGISRRTLRHVHEMFNTRFKTSLSWEQFMALRTDAIREGRAKTTYLKHYYKNENSSERELRRQKPFLKSRITGGCQYKPADKSTACGAPTTGRYCEAHVQAAFNDGAAPQRGMSYLDSSLGKYG